MNSLFYPKLALDNIKKNKKIYFPYVLACIFIILMFYMITSLSFNKGLEDILGGDVMRELLGLGKYVIGLFSIIFLFYTNSFLMKRRKKEFGLFNVLGMGKAHLGRVVLLETLFIFALSMVIGIALGICFDKLIFLSLIKLISQDVPLGFHISFNAIRDTILLFGFIFLLILIYSLIQIIKTKPIELLKSESTGEKEPKGNWLLAILGIICLVVAYYISITTKDPVAAILLFFGAVILVIIGTYLIFTSTSIVVLKLLRKNKNFYYKTNHFISISSMIYRMKQNAIGIANICILSTMVLVMISTTSSLWLAAMDLVESRYPTDIAMITTNEENVSLIQDSIHSINRQLNTTIDDEIYYKRLNLALLNKQNRFETPNSTNNALQDINSAFVLSFITLDDYNRLTNSNETLNADEILLYSNRTNYTYNYDNLLLNDKEFSVKNIISNLTIGGDLNANISNTLCIVVKDDDVYETIYQMQLDSIYPTSIEYYYSFNLNGATDDEKVEYGSQLKTLLNTLENNITLEQRVISIKDILALYAGLFFIGIFLSLVFVIATILIMYYKQVSEGYEDKKRFEIMKKVGLSTKDIKKSIRSQILFVFFLPLITAGIHVAFAFPVIERLMNLLYFDNTKLFIIVTISCFLIFSAFYAVVYNFTARTYYKIVNN